MYTLLREKKRSRQKQLLIRSGPQVSDTPDTMVRCNNRNNLRHSTVHYRMDDCDHPYPLDGVPFKPTSIQPDMVNHPPHYGQHPSGVECITIAEHYNFNVGNAIKYLWRSHLKNGLQDLKKARWYVDREIARLEGNPSAANDSNDRLEHLQRALEYFSHTTITPGIHQKDLAQRALNGERIWEL